MKLSSRLCAIFGLFPRSASPLQVPVQVTSKRKSIVGRGPFAVHDLLAGLPEPTGYVAPQGAPPAAPVAAVA